MDEEVPEKPKVQLNIFSTVKAAKIAGFSRRHFLRKALDMEIEPIVFVNRQGIGTGRNNLFWRLTDIEKIRDCQEKFKHKKYRRLDKYGV